jgi:hypothetical protein
MPARKKGTEPTPRLTGLSTKLPESEIKQLVLLSKAYGERTVSRFLRKLIVQALKEA